MFQFLKRRFDSGEYRNNPCVRKPCPRGCNLPDWIARTAPIKQRRGSLLNTPTREYAWPVIRSIMKIGALTRRFKASLGRASHFRAALKRRRVGGGGGRGMARINSVGVGSITCRWITTIYGAPSLMLIYAASLEHTPLNAEIFPAGGSAAVKWVAVLMRSAKFKFKSCACADLASS